MPAARAPRRGPRGADAHTRDDILRAALACFTENGYAGTSMRSIAREAGVDPSLPRHYFPTKSQLFVEALGPVDQLGQRVEQVLAGKREDVGATILRVFLDVWDSPVTGPRLRTLVTSAAGSPEIAEVAKAVLMNRVVLPIARGLGPDDAEARAALTLAHVLGLAVTRYVLRVEPLASARSEWIVDRFGPNVQRAIAPPPSS